MSISQFRCPERSKTVKMAKPKPAGTKVRCPKCEAPVRVRWLPAAGGVPRPQ